MPRLQVVEMNYCKTNSSGNVEWQTWCRGGRVYISGEADDWNGIESA